MSDTNTSTNNRLLQAALMYAQCGFYIIPVKGDKTPYTKNGLHDASRDAETIHRWWARWPKANIAIVCGEDSDLVTLDVDYRHDGHIKLEAYADAMPDTLMCETPGGRHYYYRYPRSGYVGTTQLNGERGLDIRSNNAYALVPPSVSDATDYHNGGDYKFIDIEYYFKQGLFSLPEWPFETYTRKPAANFTFLEGTSTVSLEEIKSALNALDPDMEYLDWVQVMMAVHSEYPGEEGYLICDAWSAKGDLYKPGEVLFKWKTFKQEREINIDTLFKKANDTGWRWNGGDSEIDFDNIIKDIHEERHEGVEEAEEVNSPFPFVSFWELCNRSHRYHWLIEGVAEQNTMMQIFGDPESGKSLIAMDMGLSIASGIPWMGHNTAQGTVFYICGEGFGGLSRRLNAWRYARNPENPEVLPFYTSENAADLTNKQSTKNVIDSIRLLCDETKEYPKLIIVDTLARNFGGGDENDTQMMNQFVRHVDVLRSGFEATILVVHHTGHAVKTRARGAMPLLGALDLDFVASRDDEGVITFKNTKVKDIEKPKPMFFSIESMVLPDEPGLMASGPFIKPVERESVEDIEQEATRGRRAGRPGIAKERALETLELMQRRRIENGETEGWVYVDEWKFKCDKDYDISDGSLRKIKQRLLEAGEIEQNHKMVRIVGLKIRV